VRVSRGFNASNVVEIVTRLVFLFLHSGEGKKCFRCCAKIILGNCWRLLGDTEQLPRERQFSSFQSSDCQAGDGRAQVAAADRDRRGDDHHELGRYESSVDGADSNAAKAFQQSFRDDRLVARIKIDDEGKNGARAIPHHPARRHGARYLKSGVGLTSYARYARAARRSSRT